MPPPLAAREDDDAQHGGYPQPASFKARLQILGVIREDVGTGRDYKSAATDAFKRVAVRFGVAHELYAYEQKEAEFSAADRKTFQSHGEAWSFFKNQPPSYRKTVINWVTSAKREATRASRLAELVESCAAGRLVGHRLLGAGKGRPHGCEVVGVVLGPADPGVAEPEGAATALVVRASASSTTQARPVRPVFAATPLSSAGSPPWAAMLSVMAFSAA